MYKISYTADGIATEFGFSFPFFQPADINVAINNEAITNSHYDLANWEERRGGTIIFATAPEKGSTIDIYRKISLDRFIDYQPTAKIDPEKLNEDFNFLVEALRDSNQPDIDVKEWQNVFENTVRMIEYTKNLIDDSLEGGAFMGLHRNLLGVLATALPGLRNDCGVITDESGIGIADDYGVI